MPGRSGRDEFCREHADCKDSSLKCVAHICTDDHTVTCQDVLRLSDAATLNGFHWGAVEGRTLPLSCHQDGFTLLLITTRDVGGWNSSNWKNRSEPADPGYAFQQQSYSILSEAERIRDSSAIQSHFQVIMLGLYPDGSTQGLRMTLKRSAPLLATTAPDPSLIVGNESLNNEFKISGNCTQACRKVMGELTVPYYRGRHYLLTANKNPRTDPDTAYGEQFHDYGTLIKDNGDVRLKFYPSVLNYRPKSVKYYIRE